MPPCDICHKRPQILWTTEDDIEILIFWTAASFQLHQDFNINELFEKTARHGFSYCPEHIFSATRKLKRLVDYDEGKVSSMGLRLVELMASNILKEKIKEGSMKTALRRFIYNFHEENHSTIGEHYSDEYKNLEIEDRDGIYICIQCGEDNEKPETRFIEDYESKKAFAVFAGAAVANLMNVDQAHACTVIPSIPICAVHLYQQAWSLRNLEFTLHEKNHADVFTETMMATFGSGWMAPLKVVNKYVDKILPHPTLNHMACKFCNEFGSDEKPIIYDKLLRMKAHRDCFTKVSRDIMFDMSKKDFVNGGFIFRYPNIKKLESFTGDEFKKLINSWVKYTAEKADTNARYKVYIVMLFARYWSPDPDLKQKENAESLILGYQMITQIKTRMAMTKNSLSAKGSVESPDDGYEVAQLYVSSPAVSGPTP
ncbi:Protein CBG19570 [Caenorhabditis briggsae]|uniref:Uncharacterized protein n=2 Tax=Caenorhabditis briggsae TaxID=6238 RepID=A0AAE9DM47_CAEBR|nr:Protein CBG19570 [Caenorhabditis briggsae]ULU07882.1 hypothetical protein L3Y34_019133 [Caenorhabditis briggsae]CAP36792.1 Protein CBG19570 [Caenorhabditis briggsae]